MKLWLSASNCEHCKCTLEAYCPLDDHDIILTLEGSFGRITRALTYPTLLFMSKFKLLFKIFQMVLPSICHEKKLLQKLLSHVENIELDGLGCKEHCHDIYQKLKQFTAKLCIQTFTKEVNAILSRKTVDLPPNSSEIHKSAFDIVKKRKGIGKYGQEILK